MDGKAPPAIPERVLPKGVVTRKSTDTLAVEYPGVASALRFIQDNFTRSMLSVDMVVAAGTLPRRSLEKAFRQELDRTILSEILRVRINRARHLLETTPLAVAPPQGAIRNLFFVNCPFAQALFCPIYRGGCLEPVGLRGS
jgi:LacI family transcriptional regulator